MKKITKLLSFIVVFTLLAVLAGCKKPVDNRPTFTVGMECAYAPFNWQTATETETSVSLGDMGYADGYDVQIAKKIAEDYNVPFERVKTDVENLINKMREHNLLDE